MSNFAEKMVLSDQARKIIEQHTRAIQTTAEEVERKLTGAATVLSAVCTLLNSRARYIGATGEHFSVHHYEGIQVVDAVDEHLMRTIRALLQGYVERAGRSPDPKAVAFLAEKLTPSLKDIPQYPVSYMIHYFLLSSFQAFDPLLETDHGFDLPVLELAMVHHIREILDRYSQTREKPVMRHFSDVAREYSVVMRMKCGCGAEKYDVKLQALCQTPEGEPFDRLDLQCSTCGAQRSITFDLPHFKDMYQI